MRGTFVLVSLLLASAALAAVPGLDAYKRGDYQAAARELKAALLAGELSSLDAAQARMYLAACHHALRDNAAAKASLEELFRGAPDTRLDGNIFDPELVALSEQVRAAEHKRREQLAKAAAEKAAAEEKQRRAEAEANQPPEIKAPVVEARPYDVRVGLFGLADVGGSPVSATAALMVSGVFSGFEVGLRVLPGSQPLADGSSKLTFAFGAEVAYLFFPGDLSPRAGARVTLYPGLPSGNGNEGAGLGGGVVAGVRYKVVDFLAIGADAAAELNQVPDPDRYRSLSVVLSAGAQVIF